MTVPPGVPVASVEEAELAAATVPRGADGWVVKAQIHAGGRGKAGGVKLAGTPAEVKAAAAAILGKTLVTPQTGPEGRLVRTVLIESASKIARELYAAVVLDRSAARPVMLASAEGGMDIETLAREKPESILREPVDVLRGLRPHAGRALGKRLGLSGKLVAQAGGFFAALARTYLESDASLVEVNPLAVTGDGTLMSLDAKVSLDDSALFRHPDLAAWRDPNEEDAREIRAAQAGVSYIRLDGSVGCVVNGAGLAMATMDLIKFHGGEPANFLDVGGGASQQQVAEAFRILLSDEHVKAVLVNIFGGILQCDRLARGMVEALSEPDLKSRLAKIPVVIRLEGTNVEEGRRILLASGLPLTAATDLTDAAKKVVAAARS